MTAKPPIKNVYCQPISKLVPVPVLVWTEYHKDHFRAEPLPGFVYYVMKNEESFGWLFEIPGKPVTPCSRREIATNTCEFYWFKAIKSMLNGYCEPATAGAE